MAKLAVVKTGGKQYLVSKDSVIVVDKVNEKLGKRLDLETLAVFTDDGSNLKIGSPTLAEKIKAEVLSHDKGVKVRVAKFKAKVRFRKVRGFRPLLTTLKIKAF